jgi:4-hydroxythreonine-4-phosphate dehydrogenase
MVGNLQSPCLVITMGDVAGVGPEIIACGWQKLNSICRPVVIGDPSHLRRALGLVNSQATVQSIANIDEADPSIGVIPCRAGTSQDLTKLKPGQITGAGGRAAYDFLCLAIDLVLNGEADGIVTAPLHKEGLRAAGLDYPGHTEILASRTGATHYGMVLYAEGLAVIHVTLHMALREVFQHLSTGSIAEKIRLLHELLSKLLKRRPRIGVAALNPHASDGGLFGDEEANIIEPAVRAAQKGQIDVIGPLPSDTLFVRARGGEFDGVVAMYHDQGHIALKLIGGLHAVNISVGLPIIRTSVAHGTAYDIAGRGIADPTSLIEAALVAAKLASQSAEKKSGKSMPP